MVKKSGSYAWHWAILLTILIAVAGVTLILTGDQKVAGSVVARPLGWLAPLIALSVVLGVSGVLMTQRRSNDEGETSFDKTRCPACEREVMGQWRMCPYCGAMLEATNV